MFNIYYHNRNFLTNYCNDYYNDLRNLPMKYDIMQYSKR